MGSPARTRQASARIVRSHVAPHRAGTLFSSKCVELQPQVAEPTCMLGIENQQPQPPVPLPRGWRTLLLEIRQICFGTLMRCCPSQL